VWEEAAIVPIGAVLEPLFTVLRPGGYVVVKALSYKPENRGFET
jgi:hypothetical protein